MTEPVKVVFDPMAYRQDHPDATPEESRLAHRDALGEALHAKFLDLLDTLADRCQLAVLTGGTIDVGIQIQMPEMEQQTGPQLVQ